MLSEQLAEDVARHLLNQDLSSQDDDVLLNRFSLLAELFISFHFILSYAIATLYTSETDSAIQHTSQFFFRSPRS